ncbi:ZMYM1 protein, partial [Amia calva]|nr:ZMYM1 protein [Amia calva]
MQNDHGSDKQKKDITDRYHNDQQFRLKQNLAITTQLSPSRYFNACLFCADNRFARDTNYIFFAQFIIEMNLASSSMSIQRKLQVVWDLLNYPNVSFQNISELLHQSQLTYKEYMDCIEFISTSNTIIMRREPKDCWVNGYNKHLLKAWNANMDIQYILNPYCCIVYNLSYISKAEHEMSEILKTVMKKAQHTNTTDSQDMKQVMQAYAKNRQVSAQEAVARKCCMAEFASTYRIVYRSNKNGKNTIPLQNNIGYIQKRTRGKPAVIRYARFSQVKQPKKLKSMVLQMEAPQVSRAAVRKMYQSLNRKQASVFYSVRDWCTQCVCGAQPKQLFCFVSGGAGTGKSHPIKCIYTEATKILHKLPSLREESDITKPSMLLTAFTGTAAFNISGKTLHSILKLPQSLKPSYQGLGNCLDEVRAKLSNAQILIIDEVAMVVYSVKNDSAVCFCCRIFGKWSNMFSDDGYNNWRNLSSRLKMHERSSDHKKHMESWHSLSERLKTNTAIDQVSQELLSLEVKHWKEVLRCLITIVSHLAERNTIDAIVERVRKAKYFSVIMDSTPDLSHHEQLSVVIRIVNCETSKGVSIHEHFVGFLNVVDTTGKGLCESFLGHLDALGLDISNCRGQSYDNGSNMQGKKQGVEKRVLEMNSKALYVPCGSHTLNLVGDAAKSSVKSISFFGLLQRLHTRFSSSVHRRDILREHVKDLTVKTLSTARWECRVDSVKAVRYQLPEMVNALSALLQTYWSQGLTAAKTDAREIAEKLEVGMSWPEVHQRKAARQFQYEGREQTVSTPEEQFEREFFLPLVDTALVTIEERFSHMERFHKLYGFLYSHDNMRITVQEGKLDECCQSLEQTIHDIDAEDLKIDVKAAISAFPTYALPHEMLDHIYKESVLDMYPNLSIALRLLLTLPVTVASGESSFSSLKLIKTYLRTSMSQERLSSLAVLFNEHEVRKTLDTESLITRFAEAKLVEKFGTETEMRVNDL